MHGVHHRRLGKDRYFLVVPVDEDMTCCREDVGGATYRKEKSFQVLEGKRRETDFEDTSCTQREHGQNFERHEEPR